MQNPTSSASDNRICNVCGAVAQFFDVGMEGIDYCFQHKLEDDEGVEDKKLQRELENEPNFMFEMAEADPYF